MQPREFSSNLGRSYARDLATPSSWTNPVARRVFEFLSRPGTLTDMFLVEAHPRPVDPAVISAYGDAPHVIAYRLWDEPGPNEDAQSYLVRHIARAKQALGGVPYFPGETPL